MLQETSLFAAASISMSKGIQRGQIMAALMECPNGLTDEQIQANLGISGNTSRPRRGELVKLGLVRDSGRRGKTSSGRNAIIWEIVP